VTTSTDPTTRPGQARRPLRLAQVVAIVAGAKARALRAVTDAYQDQQKTGPLSGISRTYQPLDDEGVRLPSESTLVQIRADEIVERVRAEMTRLLDVVATQDWGNTHARADIVVDGRTILADVPVTYLMWLEKQVHTLRTFVSELPRLDLAEQWTWDTNQRAYVTQPVQTARTTKVPRNHVLAPPTDRHPAQVQVWQEDVVVGTWTTVKANGGLPASQVRLYVERCEALLDAVKAAREAANDAVVEDIDAGVPILEYVFG
jgi:hypothetical protein